MTNDSSPSRLAGVPLPPFDGVVPDSPEVDIDLAAKHAEAMLTALGLPYDSEHNDRTPRRFVRALAEMTAGRLVDPGRHLEVTFPSVSDNPTMILVVNVRFVSLCEHHLLPWVGRASVAYLPATGARIVGLSKLARLVKEFAARPQVQERLGEQVVTTIERMLDTTGVACLIRGAHSCMNLRGVEAEDASMVSSHLLGRFRDDPAVRAEFIAAVGSANSLGGGG